MTVFSSPWDVLPSFPSNRPIACGRRHLLEKAAFWFTDNFKGKTLYAVKANPSPWVLETLYACGITHFDVASENEIETVKAVLPNAEMSYMHPIKSRYDIRRAYNDFGIRTFALDCEAELNKILDETQNATDLTLMVRIAVSNQGAELPIDGKFGVELNDAAALIKNVRNVSQRLGLCFHPGSQCMDPLAWSAHCETLSRLIRDANVPIDIIDVGGGFPVDYPGKDVGDINAFTAAIHDAFDKLPVSQETELWCEPGRALVAESTSILTHVDLVRKNTLYINDGAFGTLYDAAHCHWSYPTRLIRADRAPTSDRLKAFSLFGPTCDSADHIPGPIFLPEDVKEGDAIEIGTLGAYGIAMQSRFNGFGECQEAFVADTPWTSTYDKVNQTLLSI